MCRNFIVFDDFCDRNMDEIMFNSINKNCVLTYKTPSIVIISGVLLVGTRSFVSGDGKFIFGVGDEMWVGERFFLGTKKNLSEHPK